MPWYYSIAKAALNVLLALLTQFQVTGKKNVPKQGSLLVVSNHLNNVDPPLVGFVVSRKMAFMAKEELFRVSIFFTWLIHLFGAFPVRRGQLDHKAMRQAEKVLDDGLALILFPEGMRSLTGKMLPAYPGVALIASRSGAPILPIGITGTEQIKGIAWLWHRPRIKINIGQPFKLPQVSSNPDKVELAGLTEQIMLHIAGLLPPEYRGEYAARD